MRTSDTFIIQKAIETYAKEIVGLDIEEWLANPFNIALTNDKGDVAMFEHQVNLGAVVCAHYFYFSRGKQAIEESEKLLRELFTEHYPEVIIGLTPVEHKAALWMNRKLGFKEHGSVDTEIGPCKFVLLTKDMWKEKYK
jgi:hypothetical protein